MLICIIIHYKERATRNFVRNIIKFLQKSPLLQFLQKYVMAYTKIEKIRSINKLLCKQNTMTFALLRRFMKRSSSSNLFWQLRLLLI